MIRFVGAKLFGAIVAVLGASVVSFWLMRVIPGDPVALILGPAARDPQAVAGARKMLGLDLPLWRQYGRYMNDFVHGRWGRSFKFGEGVYPLLRRRMFASIELGLYAFALAFTVAMVAAVLTTYRRSRVLAKVANGTAHVGLGVPPFWVGLILLLVLFRQLDWLPGPGRISDRIAAPPPVTRLYTIDYLLDGNLSGMWDALTHLLLPSIALGLAPGAFLYRLFRANLLDVADSPFLLVARTKGVSRLRAFVRHAVPNAFLPTLTASGLLLGQMLGGSVLIENLFRWGGVGAAVSEGIANKDFTVVQAFILISAALYVVISALIDVFYGMVDPRLRKQGASA